MSERGLPSPIPPDPRPLLEKIETRLATVEAAAKRPEWRTWAFWFSVIAIVIGFSGAMIAVVAWQRPVPTPSVAAPAEGEALKERVRILDAKANYLEAQAKEIDEKLNALSEKENQEVISAHSGQKEDDAERAKLVGDFIRLEGEVTALNIRLESVSSLAGSLSKAQPSPFDMIRLEDRVRALEVKLKLHSPLQPDTELPH